MDLRAGLVISYNPQSGKAKTMDAKAQRQAMEVRMDALVDEDPGVREAKTSHAKKKGLPKSSEREKERGGK